jgi:predicted DNA-binding transcriptional regulator AlpA
MAQSLPRTGFVRLSTILGSPKANPPIPALIPIGRSSWYAGVKAQRYPKGIKLGPHTTVYRVEDIRRLIQDGTGAG